MFICNLIIKLLQTLILGEGKKADRQPVIPQTPRWPEMENNCHVLQGDQSPRLRVHNHCLNFTGVTLVCLFILLSPNEAGIEEERFYSAFYSLC